MSDLERSLRVAASTAVAKVSPDKDIVNIFVGALQTMQQKITDCEVSADVSEDKLGRCRSFEAGLTITGIEGYSDIKKITINVSIDTKKEDEE